MMTTKGFLQNAWRTATLFGVMTFAALTSIAHADPSSSLPKVKTAPVTQRAVTKSSLNFYKDKASPRSNTVLVGSDIYYRVTKDKSGTGQTREVSARNFDRLAKKKESQALKGIARVYQRVIAGNKNPKNDSNTVQVALRPGAHIKDDAATKDAIRSTLLPSVLSAKKALGIASPVKNPQQTFNFYAESLLSSHYDARTQTLTASLLTPAQGGKAPTVNGTKVTTPKIHFDRIIATQGLIKADLVLAPANDADAKGVENRALLTIDNGGSYKVDINRAVSDPAQTTQRVTTFLKEHGHIELWNLLGRAKSAAGLSSSFLPAPTNEPQVKCIYNSTAQARVAATKVAPANNQSTASLVLGSKNFATHAHFLNLLSKHSPHTTTPGNPLVFSVPDHGGQHLQHIEVHADKVLVPSNGRSLTPQAAFHATLLAMSDPKMRQGGVELTGTDSEKALLAAAAHKLGLKIIGHVPSITQQNTAAIDNAIHNYRQQMTAQQQAPAPLRNEVKVSKGKASQGQRFLASAFTPSPG